MITHYPIGVSLPWIKHESKIFYQSVGYKLTSGPCAVFKGSFGYIFLSVYFISQVKVWNHPTETTLGKVDVSGTRYI